MLSLTALSFVAPCRARVYDLPQETFDLSGARFPESGGSPALLDGADPFSPALRLHVGELVYDYCWYSRMAITEPETCCFATVARGHPVHLWDATSGDLRCTYRSYDAMDELVSPYSLAFSPDGLQLFAGVKSAIHIFDVAQPGRDHGEMITHTKGQDGQPGIISCLAFNPDGAGGFAAGSYSGTAALYDARTRETVCLLEGHVGGLTHLRFSADGNYLYTGARQDPSIFCWDVRCASGAVYALQRPSRHTNQRIYFDIEPCGRHLATGGEDGSVHVFDLRDGSPRAHFQAAEDTVNGLDFHPFLPLMATASGTSHCCSRDHYYDSLLA
jgi:telomerase Cajal body protein 1